MQSLLLSSCLCFLLTCQPSWLASISRSSPAATTSLTGTTGLAGGALGLSAGAKGMAGAGWQVLFGAGEGGACCWTAGPTAVSIVVRCGWLASAWWDSAMPPRPVPGQQGCKRSKSEVGWEAEAEDCLRHPLD